MDPHVLAQRLFGDSSSDEPGDWSGCGRSSSRRRVRWNRPSTWRASLPVLDISWRWAASTRSSRATARRLSVRPTPRPPTSPRRSTCPRASSAQVNYSSTTSDRYQHRSGPTGFLNTTGTTEAWPSGRVSWARTFRDGPVTSLAAGSVVERDRATSLQSVRGRYGEHVDVGNPTGHAQPDDRLPQRSLCHAERRSRQQQRLVRAAT